MSWPALRSLERRSACAEASCAAVDPAAATAVDPAAAEPAMAVDPAAAVEPAAQCGVDQRNAERKRNGVLAGEAG